MIADLKPYSQYKESGLPWLGPVPKHWDTRRLRHVCEMRVSNVDKHSKRGETPVRLCNYVEVYKNERIRESTRFMAATASEDERVRFALRKGDVLITKDSEQWNDIAVPALVECEAPDLVCGYHLAILRARPGLCGAFLHRALDSHFIAAQFHVEANGVTRYGLSHGAIKSVAIPLPPPAEQAAIVRFLDWANGRLERAIRAKRKVIALLSEQKQAIIHNSVTRGLDPSVPLKPSVTSWLSDIPQHWEVRRFKTSVGFQEGPGIMLSDFREVGVPLLRISCLAGNEATLKGCNYLSPAKVREKWSHFAVKPGDYLLSASGSTGAVRRASAEVVGAIPYTGIIRLWPRSRAIDMEYLRLFMSARPFAEQISMAKSGVGIEHFGPTHLKRMWILLPSVEEQRAIVGSVTDATAGLETGIYRLEREIELLREYRARLVADVVTGKLDVREAAARLPDEAPLDTVEDDADLGDETEAADEQAAI